MGSRPARNLVSSRVANVVTHGVPAVESHLAPAGRVRVRVTRGDRGVELFVGTRRLGDHERELIPGRQRVGDVLEDGETSGIRRGHVGAVGPRGLEPFVAVLEVPGSNPARGTARAPHEPHLAHRPRRLVLSHDWRDAAHVDAKRERFCLCMRNSLGSIHLCVGVRGVGVHSCVVSPGGVSSLGADRRDVVGVVILRFAVHRLRQRGYEFLYLSAPLAGFARCRGSDACLGVAHRGDRVAAFARRGHERLDPSRGRRRVARVARERSRAEPRGIHGASSQARVPCGGIDAGAQSIAVSRGGEPPRPAVARALEPVSEGHQTRSDAHSACADDRGDAEERQERRRGHQPAVAAAIARRRCRAIIASRDGGDEALRVDDGRLQRRGDPPGVSREERHAFRGAHRVVCLAIRPYC